MIDARTRDVANLHRDVAQVLRKVCPGQASEIAKGRWPPIKTFEDVRGVATWLASGFESIQADVRKINARLDVVMNDSHSFDEMKAHLKRPPPGRRQDDR